MCYILPNQTAHCKNDKKGDRFWMDCLLKKASNTFDKVLHCTMKWNDQFLMLRNKILELLFH